MFLSLRTLPLRSGPMRTRGIFPFIRLVSTDPRDHSKIIAEEAIGPRDPPSLKERLTQHIRSILQGENFRKLKQELAMFQQNRKPDPSASFSKSMENNVKELRSSISIASRVVNDLTGYTRVNKLKEVISANELKSRQLRESLTASKQSYRDAVERRSESQKDMNELLEHKSNWSPADLEKFTQLYRNEHTLEQEVQKTQTEVRRLEKLEDQTHDDLIRSIMNRYHEEQVWSDKIRQFSTWGTLFIMVCNLVLVLLVQLVFEPFKRARLVRSFETKVRDLFDKNEEMTGEIESIKEDINSSRDSVLSCVIEESSRHADHVKTIRLLPQNLSWQSFKEWWTSILGGLLSPLRNNVERETFEITRSDFRFFMYFVSGFLFTLGCLIGRTT